MIKKILAILVVCLILGSSLILINKATDGKLKDFKDEISEKIEGIMEECENAEIETPEITTE